MKTTLRDDGRTLTLDLPRQAGVVTASDRCANVFNPTYEWPLIGSYFRWHASHHVVRTGQGAAWMLIVIGIVFYFLTANGDKPEGAWILLAIFPPIGIALLISQNWWRLSRYRLLLTPSRYELSKSFLGNATPITSGSFDEIESFEVESLNGDRRHYYGLSSEDDRAMLTMRTRVSHVIGSGFSSREAMEIVGKIDAFRERNVSSQGAPRERGRVVGPRS